MNRIIKALAGESNAKKYAVYAAMATAVLLVIALVGLLVTSIVYNTTNSGEDVSNQDVSSGDGAPVTSKSNISYTVVSKIDSAKLGGELVNIRSSRSELINEAFETPIYYAVKSSDIQLLSDVQENLDAMLVAFYENNKSNSALNPEGKDNGKECTMPMVCSPDKTSFELKVCKTDASIAGDGNYAWIFTNAYKYGFVADGDKFTYVGVAAATYMNKNKVASYDNLVSTLKSNGGKTVSVSAADVETGKTVGYAMYYLAANGELKVPANYDYFVIGNNTDGYVVTVELSKKVAVTTTDTTAG